MAVESLESLSVRDQTLLMMLLLFSSREYESLLALLPEKDAQQIKEQTTALMEMDRNDRIQLLVARLKQFLVYQSQSSLMTIEPSWMMEYLEKEDSFISQTIFSSLSLQIRRQLKQRLGDKAPTVDRKIALNDSIKAVLLKTFEQQFTQMPYEEFSNVLTFRDLILLNAKDLIILSREIGKISLATAFAQLGMQNIAQFLSHYSQSLQDDIISGLKEVKPDDALGIVEAKHLLEVIFANFHNVEDLFQKSGLYFIAYASNKNENLFVQQLAQRFPYAHGKMLLEFRRLLMQMDFVQVDDKKRRELILSSIISLSSQKQIDGRFAQCTISV